MNEKEFINMVSSILREFGLWAIFAWLYIQEKKAHNATKRHYIEDLREQAGYKSNRLIKSPQDQNMENS